MNQVCFVHEAMSPIGNGQVWICPDCQPEARRLLETLQLEFDAEYVDRTDVDDPRIPAYYVLKILLEQ
jgi:hypothetical protein